MAEQPIPETSGLISYDLGSGDFTWLVRAGRARPGMVAGTVGAHGYVVISIRRQLYLAHRLAWAIVHGEWPSECIDHINGKRDDNRISNLRLASRAENNRNSPGWGKKKGKKGAYFWPSRNKWKSAIRIEGRNVTLGYFDSEDDAAKAYADAAKKHFGEFARP